MIAAKKALAATLKDIGIALYIIGMRSTPESLKEYNMVKAN